jgi:hypothetical protein
VKQVPAHLGMRLRQSVHAQGQHVVVMQQH